MSSFGVETGDLRSGSDTLKSVGGDLAGALSRVQSILASASNSYNGQLIQALGAIGGKFLPSCTRLGGHAIELAVELINRAMAYEAANQAGIAAVSAAFANNSKLQNDSRVLQLLAKIFGPNWAKAKFIWVASGIGGFGGLLALVTLLRHSPASPAADVSVPAVKNTPAAPVSTVEVSGNGLPRVEDIILKQDSPEWAAVRMNNDTTTTLADAGCLETVTAMIARAYGKNVTPVDVDNWIEAHGGYGKDSYMPAGSQAGFLNDVLGRHGTVSGVASSNVAQQLAAGTPVILHIPSTTPDGHYVLAVGVDSNGRYVCADPATGKQRLIAPSTVLGAQYYH